MFLANTIHVAGSDAVAGLLVRLRDALVEGGRLIVHERLQLASEPEAEKQDTRERLVNGMNALRWFVGEGQAYSAEHIERLLRDCGFTEIDTSPPQGGIGVFVAWKRAPS